MKTLWIKLPDNPTPVPIEYDSNAQKLFPTFEAFFAHYNQGWQSQNGEPLPVRWAVTNSKRGRHDPELFGCARQDGFSGADFAAGI